MAAFVAEHTKDPSRAVSQESMRILVSHAVHDYKGACILFHNNPNTLLSFRKIAGNPEYTKYLSFASFKNPPKEITDTIQTKRLPSVVIFFSNFNEDHEVDIEKYPIKMGSYSGSILVAELDKYISQFLDTNAKPKKGNSDANVENLTKPAQWESCINNVLCLIAFTDQDGEGQVNRKRGEAENMTEE